MSRTTKDRLAKYAKALTHLVPGIMSPFHESILKSGNQQCMAVYVPPNPKLHLFDSSLSETKRNKAIRDFIKTVVPDNKRDAFVSVVFACAVLGQMGDDMCNDWRIGVSIAPTLELASSPEYFVLVPEHALSPFTPLAYRGVKNLAQTLLKGVENRRTRPGAVKLPVPGSTDGATFDWIEFDPRVPVEQWVKSLHLSTPRKTGGGGGGDADDDDEEEADADGEEEAAGAGATDPPEKDATPTPPAPTAAAVAVATPTRTKTAGTKRASKTPVLTSLTDEDALTRRVVQNAMAKGKFHPNKSLRLAQYMPFILLRPGFFPANFAVDLRAVKAATAALEADGAMRSQMLVEMLCMVVHSKDLYGIPLDRFMSESGATLTTTTLPTFVAQMQGDTERTRADLEHFNTEVKISADFFEALCRTQPARVPHFARIASIIAGSEKYLGCESVKVDAAPQRYCAMTGQPFVAGQHCTVASFVCTAGDSPSIIRVTMLASAKGADFCAEPPAPPPVVAVEPVAAPAPAPAPEPAVVSTPPTKKRSLSKTNPPETVRPAKKPRGADIVPFLGTLPVAWELPNANEFVVDFNEHLCRVLARAKDETFALMDEALARMFGATATPQKKRGEIIATELDDLSSKGYGHVGSLILAYLDQFVVARKPTADASVCALAVNVAVTTCAMPHFFKTLAKFPREACEEFRLPDQPLDEYTPVELAIVRYIFGSLAIV